MAAACSVVTTASAMARWAAATLSCGGLDGSSSSNAFVFPSRVAVSVPLRVSKSNPRAALPHSSARAAALARVPCPHRSTSLCVARRCHPTHACVRARVACACVRVYASAHGWGHNGGYRRREPAQPEARRVGKRARLVARREEGRFAQPHLGSNLLHHFVVDAPRARLRAGRDQEHGRRVARKRPVGKGVYLCTPTRITFPLSCSSALSGGMPAPAENGLVFERFPYVFPEPVLAE